jgi:hypothetical protein
MATANIRINGTPPPTTLGFSASVSLSNFDNSGVTAWLWTLLDRPVGSAAVLTTPTMAASTFTADKEGTYLIRLSVNNNESTDTAIAAVLNTLTGIRIPAAQERLEASSRGWAESLNNILISYEEELRMGRIISVLSPGAIAVGTPVRVTGEWTMPSGQKLPLIAVADASVASRLPAIGVVIESAIGSGVVIGVRTFGGLTEYSIDTSTISVGDPIYLSDSGYLSVAPDTIPYIIGYAATSDVSGRVFINPQSSVISSGGISLSAVGSTPNPNAASIVGSILTMQPSDDTHPGVLTALAQTIGGTKTFTSNVVAPGLVNTTDSGRCVVSGTTAETVAPFTKLFNVCTGVDGVETEYFTVQAGNSYFVGTLSADDITISSLGNGGATNGQYLTWSDATIPGHWVPTTLIGSGDFAVASATIYNGNFQFTIGTAQYTTVTCNMVMGDTTLLNPPNPTIAGSVDGQFIHIVGDSIATLTLVGEDGVNGTKLQLNSKTAIITVGQSILLRSGGAGWWYECWRSGLIGSSTDTLPAGNGNNTALAGRAGIAIGTKVSTISNGYLLSDSVVSVTFESPQGGNTFGVSVTPGFMTVTMDLPVGSDQYFRWAIVSV